MPLYTIRNEDTGEEWDELCSYSKLEKILQENPNYRKVITPFAINSGGVLRDTLSRTPDGFRDVLKKVKAGSGEGNTIKTK
jgi:hypothetical protein